jgi:hypothetical protein
MGLKRSELVVLRTFENVLDAELARNALGAADVESFIQDNDAAGMRPHPGMNRVQVVVWAHDADKAFAILGGSD